MRDGLFSFAPGFDLWGSEVHSLAAELFAFGGGMDFDLCTRPMIFGPGSNLLCNSIYGELVNKLEV